ncbi:MAG: geranylgeranylglyceryl/heptaprenylglyceryl phosphate synthase [Flavobacteriales bacterium]
MNLYTSILEKKAKGKKLFAILIDPDKQKNSVLSLIVQKANEANVDYFFVGGSLLTNDNLDECIKTIKNNSNIPVILFPGNAMQINKNADGILFLSLISGRNPELLIGKQVISAPILKQTSLEVISTGYMLIDSGKPTTASYMSNTLPIPRNKNGIATSTAIAGEYLGMKLVYMDGGSGAEKPIEIDMIKQVSNQINIPLIVGGGICNAQKAIDNCNAGADLIVVGNAIEKNDDLILEISKAVHSV